MPIYSYKCTNCDHRFEARQRFSDDPLTECPNCSGGVKRVINQVGIVFKGSGFYVTDNRNGKYKSNINGGNKDRKEKESTSEKSTDKVEKSSKGKSKSEVASAGSGSPS